MSNLNWIAVIVAAVANMVIGSVWYSKMAFGAQWMKLTGKSDMKGGGNAMVMMVVVSVIEAVVLAWFIGMTGTVGLTGGLMVGFLAWLGFVVCTNSSSVIFEGRPMKLFQINMGYQLVAFLVMGAILASL